MKRIYTILLLVLAALVQFSPAQAADWTKPLTTSTYTNFVTEIKNRDTDLALGFDPAYTTPTSQPTNAIRWNSASAKWEKWNGTTWGDLATGYAIAITGNAATATALATARTINGVSFNGTANISVNTVNALTFNNGGTGAASGSTFNGSAAQTISYNTIGAPSATGGSASGTWGISITGNAATATSATSATSAASATSATTATNLAGGSAGTVPYQSAAGTTVQLPAGTNGYYYRANGAAAPAWEAPATVFSNIKQAASETATGVVELATTAEVVTGTDATRAVTPAALRAANIVLGTTQATTSGTVVNFTGIPSWVKRITVALNGVSTNGTGNLMIQIGDSGGLENAGYVGAAVLSGSSATNYTNGFLLTGIHGPANISSGSATLTLINSSTNTWSINGILGRSDAATANLFGGVKSLSAALTQLTLTTENGIDTFDAGSVNIIYE